MKKELLLANIVVLILDSGLISNRIEINKENWADTKSKIELCNAILIPHKKRYLACVDEPCRKKETSNMLSNYNLIFKENDIVFVPEDIIKTIFQFFICDNVHSLSFREACVAVYEVLKSCDILEVKRSILSKMMNLIIRCALYGSEPFDTLLKNTILELQQLETVDLDQVLFLE